MGLVEETIRGAKILRICAQPSVEGYCCAAILARTCSFLGNHFHLRFGTHGDCDVSVGGPHSTLPTVEDVYRVALSLDPRAKATAQYVIINALAQRKDVANGYVQDALSANTLVTKVGVSLHGMHRPLLQMIEYSLHPWFGGTKEAAERLLKNAHITPQIGTEYKTLAHLSDEEMGRLAEVLEPHVGPLISQSYILPGEKEHLRDAREFAMALRVFEGYGLHTLGFGLCLGDKKARNLVRTQMLDYHSNVRKFMNHLDAVRLPKSFHYVCVDDVPSAIVEHYLSYVKSHGPVLLSIRADPKTIHWHLLCDDHPRIMKTIADMQQLPVSVGAQCTSCVIPLEHEGRLLEFAASQFQKLQIEEAI